MPYFSGRDAQSFSDWVSSLSGEEREEVYRVYCASVELLALSRAARSASITPILDVSTSRPAVPPSPVPAAIHPLFGWREVGKWILVGLARYGGVATNT